jgi:hypothetical protein
MKKISQNIKLHISIKRMKIIKPKIIIQFLKVIKKTKINLLYKILSINRST